MPKYNTVEKCAAYSIARSKDLKPRAPKIVHKPGPKQAASDQFTKVAAAYGMVPVVHK